jgi:hypothetical protein
VSGVEWILGIISNERIDDGFKSDQQQGLARDDARDEYHELEAWRRRRRRRTGRGMLLMQMQRERGQGSDAEYQSPDMRVPCLCPVCWSGTLVHRPQLKSPVYDMSSSAIRPLPDPPATTSARDRRTRRCARLGRVDLDADLWTRWIWMLGIVVYQPSMHLDIVYRVTTHSYAMTWQHTPPINQSNHSPSSVLIPPVRPSQDTQS